jgi:protein-S-isoprenylcysteine O-methyltransferase Ste14
VPATETQRADQTPVGETPVHPIVRFIVRRRVAISVVLITVLVGEDLLSGVVPRDLRNLADPVTLAGLCGVLFGLALRSWAAGFLIKNSELTTDGPYAIVRNPLYLGSFLMVAGFCLLVNDPRNIWVLSAALALLYVPKVRSEERLLASVFPDQWPQYAARTPRFLPRSLSLPRLAGWRLSQWLRSREYNAVLASAAALVALAVVRNWHDWVQTSG